MLALDIKHLTKTYKNGVKALKDVSLQVESGDFFALLGPNGAGKSTTIGILTSLVLKTSGEVSILGHNIDSDFQKAKAQMGVVPQEFNMHVFRTLQDSLIAQAGFYGVPYKEANRRALKYLDQLELMDKRNKTIHSLSGGMKRRFMIARALMNEPKLLFLDEPTAGVDIEIRRSMWGFLQQLNAQGVTIILTTHYLEEAENLCKNVAIINHGEVIERGSVSQLLTQLDAECFILYLKAPCQQVPSMDGVMFKRIDDLTLEADVDNAVTLTQLMLRLSATGVEVLRIRNKANRLEELFLRLTAEEGETT